MLLIILCAMAIIFIPLAMVNGEISPDYKGTNSNATAFQKDTTQEKSPSKNEETIAVFRTVSNKTINLTMHEYVCGSVAAEMPLAYEEEALKAQAIACYTNALRLKSTSDNKSNGDISDNTAIHQGYIDENERKKKWGKDFEKYEEKLQDAVNSVENTAIYYNDELCVAAFCAISNGKTEDAKYLWGTEVPYLKSVESEGDKLSPGYASTLSYSKSEFTKLIKNEKNKTDNINTLKNIIKTTKKSPSGTVLKCEINGNEYTGEEVRKLFSLRSPTFTVKSTDSAITFSVSGYGHGIGLSQYGANYLAQQGYSYEEILKHYYTGVEIK